MDFLASALVAVTLAQAPAEKTPDPIVQPAQVAQEEIKQEKKDEKKDKKMIARDMALDRWKDRREKAKEILPQDNFTINASAYTASADECGKSDGITASGVSVLENRTLACPPEYPFGTKIAIDGMGTYVCEDRGGAIKGNKFDIYMETKDDAFAFGRQQKTARIVYDDAV